MGLARLTADLRRHPNRPLTQLIGILPRTTPRTTSRSDAPSSFPRTRAPADPRPNHRHSDDIADLGARVPYGLEDAIVGKSLYAGAFALAEALDVAGI